MKEDVFLEMQESINGMDETKASQLAQRVLEESIDPLPAIERGYARGLQLVGDRFEKGEIWLPELIMSAEIMKKVMKILEPEITRRGEKRHSLGRIVLGTARGDIHDIGKNIVLALLSAAGFEVYDLGKDVPVEQFINKVKETKAHIVASSSLLTTTMPVQRDIVKALLEEGLRKKVKVMVGGAPVSEDWAREIGADAYGENAVEAVKKAKEILEIKE